MRGHDGTTILFGLLLQYFPKGTGLSRHALNELAAVATTLNDRPRKTLAGRRPPVPQRSLTLPRTRRCCDYHLNPGWTPLSL